MKLILFDIDKTLIAKMVLKENPWKLAFKKVYELESSTGLDEVDTHGKTHKGLAIEGLKKHNVPDVIIKQKLTSFLKELEIVYEVVLNEGEVFTFNKIEELLKTLKDKGFHLGLITGNTKNIAFAKLKKARIDSFFEVGGFGEDSTVRDDLVEVALNRSGDHFGNNFSKEDVFVIGDTPLDITSAKKHLLKTVGVATGVYSKTDLQNAGADYILDNLEDIDTVVKIISS
jgi:phosphoglycolate phosphatase-like HAD superfamily hydrolase